MESRKLAMLCTAHVSKETGDMLTQTPPDKLPVVGGSFHYGWFMYAPEDAHDDRDLPADLAHVLAHVRAAGFDYVMFDCDVEPIAELPVFEW